jgi:adenylosuccinate synthase
MPVHVVVGGQYGSEGKGRIVGELLKERRSWTSHAVRCGGPNSGHTTTVNGEEIVFRQLPSGMAIGENIKGYIPAGAVVDIPLLIEEIGKFEAMMGKPMGNQLMVDPRAVLIHPSDKMGELNNIRNVIGSTASGNGLALVRRMNRRIEECELISNWVKRNPQKDAPFVVGCVADHLHRALDKFENVVIEGNQGFGLSLLHGTEWPYTTSRDTTASGFLSEVGIPPRSPMIHKKDKRTKTHSKSYFLRRVLSMMTSTSEPSVIPSV